MLHPITPTIYFYHIPKTAGRAYLQQELNTVAKGHAFVDQHPPDTKIVTFLRCPVDRFLSCYYMFTTTYKDDPRQDHIEQRRLIKESPLATLDFILSTSFDIDSLQVPAHMSTQYRWHRTLRPEDTIYRSFAEYKKGSAQIAKFKSDRVGVSLEPYLPQIREKVGIVYAKDYEYFASIPQAAGYLSEWA